MMSENDYVCAQVKLSWKALDRWIRSIENELKQIIDSLERERIENIRVSEEWES